MPTASLRPLHATLLALVVAAPAVAQDPATEPAAEERFATPLERSSYALGYSLGSSFHETGAEVAVEQVIAGLRAGLEGEEAPLDEGEIRILSRQLQNEMARKQREKRAAVAAENMAAGEAFLAENARRPEVVTLESGLQYEILEAGEGERVESDDSLLVDYHGTLIDGSVFDSSRRRGEPARMVPELMVPGWKEALPMMSVGSKWKLFIPAALAFGEAGAGRNVPPGAALVYEVEILEILEGEEGQGAGSPETEGGPPGGGD